MLSMQQAKALAQSANSNATRALNTATSALSTINDIQADVALAKSDANAASLSK